MSDALKWNFQARAPGEMRRNVYDFDSSRSSVTDDSWLLTRLRLGLEWHPVEWLNFSRTFDALKWQIQRERWWLDAFTSSVVRYHESEFNRSDWLGNGDVRNQFFSGLSFSNTSLPLFQTTDLYAFHIHEKAFAGGKALRAYSHHLEAGHNWLQSTWKPRLALEYCHGTGDSDLNDGKVNTFQNLVPTNHPPYGLMDTFSWQNMHNVVLRLATQPHAKVKTTLDFHSFWLATSGDAWHRAYGTTRVRAITPGANRHAGCELDFTVQAKLEQHLDMLLGYSRFFAGAYLSDTGASSDADFACLMLTLNY